LKRTNTIFDERGAEKRLFCRDIRSIDMTIDGASLLSADFLSRYENKRPDNAGPLFDVVYLRTYSRWLDDKGRRETWNETVCRVVEYSMSLYSGPADREQLRQEAESLFDGIFHLRVLPAGRSLWVGGTEAAKKWPESQFNCSFVVIDELEAFWDLFHMLMCGSGVGFRVLKNDVSQLPRLRSNVAVRHLPYMPLHPAERIQDTTREKILNPQNLKTVLRITVGDSKEGWVASLRFFLIELAHGEADEIEFDYDHVRPQGERIRTFGGRAAGPQGLWEMYRDLITIIQRCEGALSPVDAMDMCNAIALNVVVGGTRRSSQIALGSPDDDGFISAKVDLWTDPNKAGLKWRVMSNNTVAFERRPSKEEMVSVFDCIQSNGEPGFLNLEAARKRRPNAHGVNPCSEIVLDNRGVCNLSTVVLSSFLDKENKRLLVTELLDAVRLALRVGLRQTNVELSMPKWSEVQKRDRLTGVSMTGVMDTFDFLGWELDGAQERYLLACMGDVANEESMKYAKEMRVPAPLLVTALKPEGTLSQLSTVSCGIHRSYAPYFIRRIRVSSIDPVCKALQYLGVPNEPDKSKPDRIVFSFPIKTDAKISSAEESAVDQLRRYYMFQECYTDHNSSCTLTFLPEEVNDVVDMVLENWDQTIAVAFLPKYTKAYPQMPYEEMTKSQYEEMASSFPDISNLADVVNRFEQGELLEDELEQDPSCAGGACPVR
jgi:adenosylcobalamin-dependent ribonucleoside-triphosphate reductase